jgi:hypothetical protein
MLADFTAARDVGSLGRSSFQKVPIAQVFFFRFFADFVWAAAACVTELRRLRFMRRFRRSPE